MNMLEILASTLSADDEKRLRKIWEPTPVSVPLWDARRNLVVMPDGELRSYGIVDKPNPFRGGTTAYISSRNCGLDWSFHYPPTQSVLGAALKLPWSNRWVTVPNAADHAPTYAYISEIGPDDPEPRRVKVTDEHIFDQFLPIAIEHRIMCCGQISGYCQPVLMYSDDDGETWTTVHLKPSPKFEPVYPHLGVRWQNTSTETTFTRLPDGRIMLLARTSLDYLYVYYSSDLGSTWTDGELSDWHCTLTTSFFLPLHDGRTLFFWNNTRPLAEVCHEKTLPPVSSWATSGQGEDVFTNRDAGHAAISDDCRNWLGFREIALTECRNEPDFRVKGGILSSADKSVHQFQAIELPFNKVLVEYGQHEIARRGVIFDIDWLYEKTRTEDWQYGLKNVSTHMYVKSISDCYIQQTGFSGHCAWNRTDGALLVPDPDFTMGECLQICRTNDERLVSNKQGMVWNFPMAHKGEIKLSIRVAGSGVALRLCDHWLNPTDENASLYSLYDFKLDSRIMTPDVWHDAVIAFDIDSGDGEVRIDGERVFGIKLGNRAPQGVSYLHLQTLAEATDFKGTLIRRMEYKSLD